MPIAKVSLTAASAYLAGLDLEYIVLSMCSTYYPLPRWEYNEACHIASVYKNFLYLQKKSLPISLVPTKEIDEFWHNHILHTKKYFYDCEKIFGRYLHHEPGNPEKDTEKLILAFEKTKQLYFEEFKQTINAKK